jgi:hypothetical protein
MSVDRGHDRQRFQIGSLRCSVLSDPHNYAETLTELYRVDLERDNDDERVVDLNIEIVESPMLRTAENSQLLLVEPIAEGHRLTTDPVTFELTRRTGENRLLVAVTDPSLDRGELSFHFWIMLNRALLLLDRLLLHAAAFVIDERLTVVCGDNGAGKSTLSVAFGLRGATLLSEDSLLVTRRGANFMVSGLTSQMRIPRESEDHLLPERVLDQRISEDGRNKRLVDAAQFFNTQLGIDMRPDRLVFLRLGNATSVTPLSARDALVRLIDNTRFTYRFANSGDVNDHLDLVADLATSVPAYEAIRNDSLHELDSLVEMIGAP